MLHPGSLGQTPEGAGVRALVKRPDERKAVGLDLLIGVEAAAQQALG